MIIKPKELPGLEELGALRQGLRLTFRGCVPDEDGAPTGEYVECELIVPPLNFSMIKRLQAEQAERGAETTQEQMLQMLDSVVTTIARALQRNYRGVPRWLIEQTIDIENALEISQQIAGLSGLTAKKAAVAETASPSTGTPSTAT